ncbi:hypothetical protein NUW54_g522 [Trametes sanguinea]|uniref:Uncharacterized protein n=2 Tax=Trametes sanguinea TaxID=158606 RepID=A0ACC1Q7G8_9APHY|nr:hypothetical protein NUW54_g1644 [Trametes sanguinea]KAJ3017699.1 hypothetical protein NUW54_g522 [Trametes sanguinea]
MLISAVVDDGMDEHPAVRKRYLAPDNDDVCQRWFLWNDKITFTLNMLMHLPRSIFLQRQLNLFLWLLRVNDVDKVPSVRHMPKLNAILQRACGIDSIAYKGALGHTYYDNALNQIIAQEMANPHVQPYLHFYPEDTRSMNVLEARQAAQWLSEVPDGHLTPMIRVRDIDYYVYEPAMCEDGRVCMPVHWFTRVEQGRHHWYAKCWEMWPVSTDTLSGWWVVKTMDLEVPASSLLKNFTQLQRSAVQYRLPDPWRNLDL